MSVHNVDDLLKKYGGDPGRYQIFVLCLLVFCMCSLALNNMMSLFIIVSYPHHCKISDNWSKNESIPKLENDEYDSCHMYINASNHELGITDCIDGWQYYPPDNEWTIVQEWDLVCDKHYQAALATTLYFAGVTVGAAVFGYLADIIGRKPVMVGSLVISIVITTAILFSSNFLMYVILRFLHGFTLQGGFNCAYILAVELFLPFRRTMVAIVAQSLWPIMLCVLSVLYYFFKSWKTVHLICNVPFVFTISYIWLMPESIRWLLAVGKVSRAKAELTRVCKFNKLPLSAKFTDDVQKVVQEINKKKKQTKKNYGFMDLVKRKKMRIISFISFYYYFVAMFAFYGISFAMAGFKVNLYLSFTVTSLIELAAVLTMYCVLLRIGRKTTSMCSLGLCSAVCIFVVILQLSLPDGKATEMGVTLTAAIGRAALAGFFSSMPIFSNELSPTVIRNLLCGIANFWGRLGAMVAPQVMLLEIYVWKPLPFVICAVLCSLAAFLTRFLPETKDKPLPDIPEEVDALWSNDLGDNSILAVNGNKHKKFENVPLTNSISTEDD